MNETSEGSAQDAPNGLPLGQVIRWAAEFLPTLLGLAAGALMTALLGLAYGIHPVDLFSSIKRASFGSMFALEDTLSRSGPLMLTGLAVVIPARAGLILLGGEGALVAGGLTVAVASVLLPFLPGGAGSSCCCCWARWREGW